MDDMIQTQPSVLNNIVQEFHVRSDPSSLYITLTGFDLNASVIKCSTIDQSYIAHRTKKEKHNCTRIRYGQEVE